MRDKNKDFLASPEGGWCGVDHPAALLWTQVGTAALDEPGSLCTQRKLGCLAGVVPAYFGHKVTCSQEQGL